MRRQNIDDFPLPFHISKFFLSILCYFYPDLCSFYVSTLYTISTQKLKADMVS